MQQRSPREQEMMEGNFVAVSRPSRAEGVGQALQSAFRDGVQLPSEMQRCLQQLDRIKL
ncbi:hypothetical protein HJG53_08565 [Sphingomonas sp. ID1715]|uniref:hypothetical protein n=1 Tax=Sphingomonas sp. ID1715 TaxID=1656898 RepID=UPI0014886220|nr:hypothetical protein [Sphingomonas sp. ID1715]NNM76951.1 hypothetical protein [Sphingomonas sp. ID1715]